MPAREKVKDFSGDTRFGKMGKRRKKLLINYLYYAYNNQSSPLPGLVNRNPGRMVFFSFSTPTLDGIVSNQNFAAWNTDNSRCSLRQPTSFLKNLLECSGFGATIRCRSFSPSVADFQVIVVVDGFLEKVCYLTERVKVPGLNKGDECTEKDFLEFLVNWAQGNIREAVEIHQKRKLVSVQGT